MKFKRTRYYEANDLMLIKYAQRFEGQGAHISIELRQNNLILNGHPVYHHQMQHFS